MISPQRSIVPWVLSACCVASAEGARGAARSTQQLLGNKTGQELFAGQKPIDYNPETKIYWLDESPLPFSVEALIAASWITLVALLPVLTLGVQPKELSKTQITLAVLMWLVLAGGVFLFTNVLLFQSAHFSSIRSLTLVECVYFMSQVLTTVGYGDITPAKPRGQVFVGIYVLFCLLVIANFVSEVFSIVNDYADRVADEVEHKVQMAYSDLSTGEEPPPERSAATKWMSQGPPPLSWRDFGRSSLAYFLIVLVGVLFFTTYPGEGKTLLEGIYMSVITLSTVGFGAVTPATEGGKVFAAFWMLIGSTALVNLIGSFTRLMATVKAREQYEPMKALEHDQNRLELLPQNINRAQFLKFGLLQADMVQQHDLERIEQAFYCLKPDADGKLSRDAVRKFFRYDDA